MLSFETRIKNPTKKEKLDLKLFSQNIKREQSSAENSREEQIFQQKQQQQQQQSVQPRNKSSAKYLAQAKRLQSERILLSRKGGGCFCGCSDDTQGRTGGDQAVPNFFNMSYVLSDIRLT